MLSRVNTIILLLAVMAAVAGDRLQQHGQTLSAPAGLPSGDLRPDLVLRDQAGQPHHLSDFHGRRVLLNFWASWCEPCLAEMPALDQAARKFGDRGAIIVGIAMDDPSRIKAYLTRHPVHYAILLGRLQTPSTSLQLGDRDELLPFSVLLDADGRVLARQQGALTPGQLQQWLADAGD